MSRPNRLIALAAVAIPLSGLGCGGCNQKPTETPPDGAPVSTREAIPESSAFDLPMKTMPATELGVDGFNHVEVLRIRRDWGKPEFEIVMDAWVPADDPARVESVRLWWFKTNKDGERGPFSKKTKRHFDIEYARVGETSWNVDMVAGDRRYTFLVEPGSDGRVTATGTVVLPGGKRVEDCLMKDGEIHASKVLGLPTGIKDFKVKCMTADGAEHEGELAS